MGTVTGITVERAQEIEDASVISGHISGDNLYLTTKGGSEVNAGQVVPDPPPAADAWPVGSIFLAVVDTDPGILLGGGTWVRWGQGRFPVSVDATQTEFDTADEIGGAKTTTLVTANLPPHTHTINHDHDNNTLAVRYTTDPNTEAGAAKRVTDVGGASGAAGGTLADTIVNWIAPHAGASGAGSGTSEAFSNLPPYITCYMWRRTA